MNTKLSLSLFSRRSSELRKKKSNFVSNRRNILKHKANFERVPAGNWGQLVKFAHLKFGGKEPVHQREIAWRFEMRVKFMCCGSKSLLKWFLQYYLVLLEDNLMI